MTQALLKFNYNYSVIQYAFDKHLDNYINKYLHFSG